MGRPKNVKIVKDPNRPTSLFWRADGRVNQYGTIFGHRLGGGPPSPWRGGGPKVSPAHIFLAKKWKLM